MVLLEALSLSHVNKDHFDQLPKLLVNFDHRKHNISSCPTSDYTETGARRKVGKKNNGCCRVGSCCLFNSQKLSPSIFSVLINKVMHPIRSQSKCSSNTQLQN